MSGVKGTFFLVVSRFFVCLPALVLTACNLFGGFDSFRSGSKAPQASPAPSHRSEGVSAREREAQDHSGEKDTGARSRTGSVDVRARLPEGALTPTPSPQEK